MVGPHAYRVPGLEGAAEGSQPYLGMGTGLVCLDRRSPGAIGQQYQLLRWVPSRTGKIVETLIIILGWLAALAGLAGK